MAYSFPIGLNTGIVLDLFQDEPGKTLEALSMIGYKGIEIVQPLPDRPFPLPAAEFNSIVNGLGLTVTSVHTLAADIENRLGWLIDFAKSVNCDRLVLPAYPHDKLRNADDFRALGEVLSKTTEKCAASGIEFYFHHHDHEFTKHDGKYGLDILMETAGSTLLELDTYWMSYSGVDPLEYILKYKNIVRLLHLKDSSGGAGHSFTEFGTGIIDFKKIFAHLDNDIIKWLLIEQDSSSLPPLEAVKISFVNISGMLAGS